ncbi:MAG: pilin [Gammaproteobacteria bacterium]
MTTFRVLTRRSTAAHATIVIAMLLLTQNVNAQRPSIADIQAEIDALTHPFDEPAAQVATALDLLPTFQEAVVRYYRKTGSAPANRFEAGLTSIATDTSTTFITSVQIIDGSIMFFFNQADTDPSIAGETLVFTPYVSPDFTVVWRCGNEYQPPGTQLLGTFAGGNTATYIPSTIPATAHPSPCILKSFADPGTVIRAEVETALQVVPVFQDAVVDHFRQTGAPPADRDRAGLTAPPVDTTTSYIESVEILNGTIIVTFGVDAHSLIQDGRLAFTPYETPDQTVVWRCGNDFQPPGTVPLGTAGGGPVAVYQAPTIPNQFLPQPCITIVGAADYELIRQQVLEPFGVVETFKDAVETVGAADGTPTQPIPPMDRMGAGFTQSSTDTSGRYFDRVSIVNGVIIVTYNNIETHSNLRGGTMTWTPYETPDGTIVWRCGNSFAPPGTVPMGTVAAVRVAAYIAPTVVNQYLPTDCRP